MDLFSFLQPEDNGNSDPINEPIQEMPKDEPLPAFSIRPYQQTAITKTFEAWEEYDSCLKVMPTGSGKTCVAGFIAQRITNKEGNYLFIAHRNQLIEQAYKAMRGICPNANVSIEQGETYADIRAGRSHIVVASKDSLKELRRKRYSRDFFSHICIDECFVAGTLIGNTPIEEIRIGDLVDSFNHGSGLVEKRRVAHLFKNKVSSLVTVNLASGRKITCTPNHPFFDSSTSKYVAAISLEPGVKVNTIHQSGESVVEIECGGNCPDGFVYNLEVEGNNNYFANGVLVHNCHHVVAGKRSYTDILDYFVESKLHGITATPDRADEIALGTIFETVAFEYGVLDAINDGFLVPIVQQLETIEGFDISHIGEDANGDLKEAEVAEAMRSKKMLYAVATAARKYSNLENKWDSKRPTLVFCASVDHAMEVADILNGWHAVEGSGKAAAISSRMTKEDIARTLRAFRQGEIQYLTNMNIATEGADFPFCRVVIMARATKSRALYGQVVGRVVRPLTEIVPLLNAAKTAEERKAIIANSRKPGGMIVDLVGNSGQHKLITTLDILGGTYPDEVVEQAKAAILKSGKRADVEGMQKMMEEVDKFERATKRINVLLEARLTSRPVDPFNMFDVASTREPGWFKGKKPSEKMTQMLLRNGFAQRAVDEMTFFQAKQRVDKIFERKEKGLCTFKQAKILAKNGENPDMSFEEAKVVLDRIFANKKR